MSSHNRAQAPTRRSLYERLSTRIAHALFLLLRPMTLGVRGVILDGRGQVLLVRHGYTVGWHFPGGGVEKGETCASALERELVEEACVVIDGPTRLQGVFFNGRISPRDHVVVYIVENFSVTGERKPDKEIQEARFFPFDALPDGVTRGTRNRLQEIFDGRTSDGWW
jgi:ADP-ribose pyrophosphatase YjhB (NUDIX family)